MKNLNPNPYPSNKLSDEKLSNCLLPIPELINNKPLCILQLIDKYKQKNDPELLKFISFLIELFYNELSLKNSNKCSLPGRVPSVLSKLQTHSCSFSCWTWLKKRQKMKFAAKLSMWLTCHIHCKQQFPISALTAKMGNFLSTYSKFAWNSANCC